MNEPELVEQLRELGKLLESDEQSNRYLARQELAARLPDIIDALERLSLSDVTEDDVERVAKAIEQQATNDWENKVRDDWRSYARAAIAAMQSSRERD